MSFIDLTGPAGRLEALWWEVAAPKAQVVVCHPHPQQGGTLHNHLTYRIADAFRQTGVSALRFNYRGVGRSQGTYDGGVGEVDDALAALEFLARRAPALPLVAAGFSFGADIALKVAARPGRVARAMAVGLALDLFPFDYVRALTLPRAFVQADEDEFGALEHVRAFVEGLFEPKRLFVIPDSDHLATGRLDAAALTLGEAVGWLMSA